MTPSKTKSSEALFRSLTGWILQLRNVTQAVHKMGGTEFLFDGHGFMHSHGSSLLDIRLSEKDQTRVLREGKAQHHRADVHHREGWVTVRIGNEDDVGRVKELARLAYDNAKKSRS